MALMDKRGKGVSAFGRSTALSSIEQYVAKIDLSPLGELIASVLPAIAAGPERGLLERIMALKQGRFEDLERPEFQSFLVSYLRIDLSTLRTLTHVLRSQYLVSKSSGRPMEYELAARGDSAVAALTGEELEILLMRRRLSL
jgi:hypothetical protein